MSRLTPTPASGVVFQQVYRGNSPYDPDYTGTGVQPVGFDEYSAFYTNYFCPASRIKVSTIDTSGSAAPVISELVVVPTTSATTLASVDPMTAAQLPHAIYRITTTHTGSRPTIINTRMTANRIFGTRITPGDTVYQASTTADPSVMWFWHILMQVVDEATTMAAVYVYVEITYDLIFTGQRVLGVS